MTATYYDTWADRLLEDYKLHNSRVVAAIDFGQATLTVGRLLDVGCGIGWTSANFAAMGHTVTGVDISPVLIKTARRMFGRRCQFVCTDFTQGLDDEDGFDNVVMVDVYEHFPVNSRGRVHDHVRRLLKPGGRLLLTAPTPELQRTAREWGIEMQPVDEDVTTADLDQLADDIGGHVVWRQQLPLSACGHYWHCLIERDHRC